MAVVDVRCPDCESLNVVKYGKQPNGTQRYICQHPACKRRIFLLDYHHKSANLALRQQIIELALSGLGVDEVVNLVNAPKENVMEVFQLLSSFSLPPNNPRKSHNRPQRTLAG